MTHPRTDIRNAITQILASATIVASGKIYTNRNVPLAVSDLPAINLVSLPETSSPEDLGTEQLLREYNIMLQAIVKTKVDATIDDDMDAIAEKIETALKSDSSLGGKALDCYLTTSEPFVDADAEYTIGVIQLSYRVRYWG